MNETFHTGPLPLRMAGIAIEAAGVIASALKPAYDGQGYVLRLYEAAGEACETEVRLPLLGRAFPAALSPWQVKSYYLPLDAAQPVWACDFLEGPG